MRILVAAFPLAFLLAPPVVARPVASDAIRLALRAEDFVRMRDAFDQAAMIAMMAPDYQEVSPIGEVDPRERVIGFYAADKKVPAPPMTITETNVHVSGGVGTVTMRIAYAVPGRDGQVQTRALRAGFVARRIGRDWRFAFAQFTPIRS